MPVTRRKFSVVSPSSSTLRARVTAPIPIDASPAPDQFISIEEVARRLHADVPYIREKCRRRCPNAIPVYNVGRHLLFDWAQVVEWVRKSPRPIHAPHRRRKKLAKAA